MFDLKYAKIYFGPTYSFFSYIHRPQKLNGLQDTLRRLGYRVVLEPVNTIDYCMIEMSGINVFQCDMNHLLFNRPTCMDAVAQRAVAAVQQCTNILIRNSNLLWARALVEDKLFETIAHGRLKLKLQHHSRDIQDTQEGLKLGPIPSWPCPSDLLAKLSQESTQTTSSLENTRQDHQNTTDNEQLIQNHQEFQPNELQFQLDDQQSESDEQSLELNQQRLDLSRQLIEPSELQLF